MMVPHFDNRLFLGVAPQKWRLRISFFQIAITGANLTDTGAIVELDHRHRQPGILSRKFWFHLLCGH